VASFTTYLELRDRLLCALRPARNDHDVRAAAHELGRERLAEARGAAGDVAELV
jgi:hypothetical protein